MFMPGTVWIDGQVGILFQIGKGQSQGWHRNVCELHGRTTISEKEAGGIWIKILQPSIPILTYYV